MEFQAEKAQLYQQTKDLNTRIDVLAANAISKASNSESNGNLMSKLQLIVSI